MDHARRLVLEQGAVPLEDELRLPRPPGLFRRYWARHPRFADALIVAAALLLTVPSILLADDQLIPADTAVAAAILQIVACIALMWRRRRPLIVLGVTLIPLLLLDPAAAAFISGPATPIAVYSIAVHRGSRAALWGLAVSFALSLTVALAWVLLRDANPDLLLTVPLGTPILSTIGALIGINVGNRKRYIDALIARSRQLAVERDQQAQLAAAAERARIAREMHDVVSHSLTVVVALAEGAGATSDIDRAHEVSDAISRTARDALSEMRAMLGVLRSDDPTAPLAPIDPPSPAETVAAAQRAGYPVTLTTSGDPITSSTVRFAVARIVQEGLTNAMRHAPGATEISVRIDRAPDSVRIQIANDGVTTVAGTGGYGIAGLRERAVRAGGSLTSAAVGSGRWRLDAALPLPPEARSTTEDPRR